MCISSLPSTVKHLAYPMVLTGAWEAQMMTEEQMQQLDVLQRIFSSSAIMALILVHTFFLERHCCVSGCTGCGDYWYSRGSGIGSLPSTVKHLANPMVLTGAWEPQVMTEKQMKLHEGVPHGKAIRLGHILCRIRVLQCVAPSSATLALTFLT